MALRARWRAVLPAVAAAGAAGLALLPLANSQTNPTHIGWIENSPLAERLWETAVSFLVGETGHVIAEAPRERYALVPDHPGRPALALLAVRGERRERRGAGWDWRWASGSAALTAIAALAGKDYVVERNLLPALVPLLAVVAIGFAAAGARRPGSSSRSRSAPLDRLRRSRNPDAEFAAARLPYRHRRARVARRPAGDRHLEAGGRSGSLLPS